MQTKAFSELFPLFSTTDLETLESLLSVTDKHEYPSQRTVLMEDAWGNAVYFIESGWVKVRRLNGEEADTLAIIGQGDFFGEMAVIDESPRSTDVIALSNVQLISIPAQRFINTLYKDPQLHHRMLQLMVRRLRQTNIRFAIRSQPPAVKLAHTLLQLSEYGKKTDTAAEIFNIPFDDLADVADISLEQTKIIMHKLQEKGLVKINTTRNVIQIPGLKQLQQLITR